MESAVYEITLIVVSVELEFTLAVFDSVDKLACVNDRIPVPALDTFAMVLVVSPLTFVHGAVVANEDSPSVGLAVLELSLINVSICVSHPSLAVKEAILGLPTIHRVVGELDDAHTFP